MPRTAEGYITFDRKRNRYIARFTPIDPVTGKQRNFKRACVNKSEAQRAVREMISDWESGQSTGSKISFDLLARKYAADRLKEAKYAGGHKISGRRELTAPRAWLLQLRYFFQKTAAADITKGRVLALRDWLLELPTRSVVKEEGDNLVLEVKHDGTPRSVTAINKVVEMLRSVLRYGIEERLLKPESSPFQGNARDLIDKRGEKARERIPTFGEEMALLKFCTIRGEQGNAHLRPILITAADTGLRRNELFTLECQDVNFQRNQIVVRAINAKNNQARRVPMTPRVREELQKIWRPAPAARLFGVIDPKRTFATACRNCGIRDLHFHDFRAVFVSRALMAGIPLAVVTEATGHSSDEWKRYLRLDTETMRMLLAPMPGQDDEEVKEFARSVMQGLRTAMRADDIAGLL